MAVAKRCKSPRIFLAVFLTCYMARQFIFLRPFPRFLSGTSVSAVRHVKAFIDDDKEINKKDVPTKTEEEVKIENKDIQPNAHFDKGTVDAVEEVAESLKPEENHGEPNNTITKLTSLEESDNNVDEVGKVNVPLRPEVNHGEPKTMATKPTAQGESEITVKEEGKVNVPSAQGESEITVNKEGKVAVPSKPDETHDEPKVTAATPAAQGEKDNAVDDGRKETVPAKPKKTHDESKVQAQKSASQGGSVSNLDGERKGDEGEPELLGKSHNDNNESSNKDQPSFERIVLLGERHSGTTYTTSVLKRCFPSLRVDDFLIRFKHWFQPDPDFVVDITKRYLTQKGVRRDGDMCKIVNQWPKIAALDDPKSMAFNKTLVIVMFRNPYDWLDSMKKGPHHWTNHFKSLRNTKPKVEGRNIHWYGPKLLSWNEFVAANMTVGATNAGPSQLCQNAYPAGMVSPCIKSKEAYPPDVRKDYGSNLSAAPDVLPFNGHNVIYELNANGKPFRDPLELRTAKIEDFLDIPNKWDLGSFLILQHEEINMNGTGTFLERVSKIVGMKPSCNADPPKRQPSKTLDDGWTKWISEHASWETEAKVGYQRRAGAPPPAVRNMEANRDVSEKKGDPPK